MDHDACDVRRRFEAEAQYQCDSDAPCPIHDGEKDVDNKQDPEQRGEKGVASDRGQVMVRPDEKRACRGCALNKTISPEAILEAVNELAKLSRSSSLTEVTLNSVPL